MNINASNNDVVSEYKELIFGSYSTLAQQVFGDTIESLKKMADSKGSTEQQIFHIILTMKQNGATELTEASFAEYYAAQITAHTEQLKADHQNTLSSELETELEIIAETLLNTGLTSINTSLDHIYTLILFASFTQEELKGVNELNQEIQENAFLFSAWKREITPEQQELALRIYELIEKLKKYHLSSFSKIDLNDIVWHTWFFKNDDMDSSDYSDTIEKIRDFLSSGKKVEDMVDIMNVAMEKMLARHTQRWKIWSTWSALQKTWEILKARKPASEKVDDILES